MSFLFRFLKAAPALNATLFLLISCNHSQSSAKNNETNPDSVAQNALNQNLKSQSDSILEKQNAQKESEQNFDAALKKISKQTPAPKDNGLFGFGKPYEGTLISKPKLYLVDFWATWCGPCQIQSQTLSKMNGLLNQKGVQIIGVSDENLQLLKRFSQKHPHSFAQFQDAQGLSDSKYNVNSLPTLILMDSTGKTLETLEGESEEAEILEIIKKHLK